MSAADTEARHLSFDRYARMVCRALEVPVALVTMAEGDHQVFLGRIDPLPEPFALRSRIPATQSLCQYVVRDRKPLVVEDLRHDERLTQHLDLVDEGIIAYAGWPVTDHRDGVIGSLCAIDNRPRRWREDDLEQLRDLAVTCSAELTHREFRRLAVLQGTNALQLVDRGRLLLALSEALAVPTTLVEIATAIDGITGQLLESQRAALWLLPRQPDWEDEDDGPGPDDVARGLDLVLVPGDQESPLVRHSVLTPSGDNPVGDVCLTQRPLFYDTRDDQQIAYPDFQMTEAFGDARAFLPLTLGGAALGVMVIGWPTLRVFDSGERGTLAALATYTAQAVHRALLLQEQLDTSYALQQAMFTDLPTPAGLELVARYRPAATRERVGGDWYDALVMPSGSVCIACGDVVGHNIVAAAAMGQLRSVLRSFAWAIDDGPSFTVEQLDRALPSLGIHSMATLVYARIDPPEAPGAPWGVRWTSAGHPPPVLLDADGCLRTLEPAEQDVMLGVQPEDRRHVHGVEVHPGSILVFYTDGLVERRGESLDVGIQRLCDVVSTTPGLSLDDAVDRVLTQLLPDPLVDDVAVIAVRFGDT